MFKERTIPKKRTSCTSYLGYTYIAYGLDTYLLSNPDLNTIPALWGQVELLPANELVGIRSEPLHPDVIVLQHRFIPPNLDPNGTTINIHHPASAAHTSSSKPFPQA